jgi:hypothetical protein
MVRRTVLIVFLIAAVCAPQRAAIADVPWVWPVRGAIVRGFDPPDQPYGSGHRGIDIAAGVGTVVVAPDDGVVTFAGPVGGRLFLTIDHGRGVTSTSSFVSQVLVKKGTSVLRGQAVAISGWGHADATVPHLHFGVRLNGTYVDPLLYLEAPSAVDVIRLAPLETSPSAYSPAAFAGTGRMTGLAYPTSLDPAHDRAPNGRSVPGSGVRGRSVAAVPRRYWPHGVHRSGARGSVRGQLGGSDRPG